MVRIAALLALYISAVHIFAGQRRVVAPLRACPRSALPSFPAATLLVVFHMVSFMLVGTALLLGWFAERLDPIFRCFLAAQVACGAALFLARGTAGGGGLRFPQWVLLGPLAVAIAAPSWAASLVLLAMALTHVGWMAGVSWPAPSWHAAPAYLIGWPPGSRFPSTRATALVVAALLVMAWTGVYGPRWATLVTASVLGLRGVYGLFEVHVRPGIAQTPYRLLSAVFYSPLCLFLAALLVAGIPGRA